jgi:CRP-like cAMP-binding protein
MYSGQQPQKLTPPDPSTNRILSTLPADEAGRVFSLLTYRQFFGQDTVHKEGDPLGRVYFPLDAVFMRTRANRDGAQVHVATIGSDGLAGLETAIGSRIACADVRVYKPGTAAVLSVDVFQRELAGNPQFAKNVRRYAQKQIDGLTQLVACNALHTIPERLSRWLLEVSEAMGAADVPATHDFIAEMLGVRRPTVTVLVNQLVRSGAIAASRGRIRILDRATLERAACECVIHRLDPYERAAMDTAV